ncbi:MAG: methyl-accepting chemotaxis protein [Chloroflexota bacterium]|nr:methyl-accepting chemotaxis protein [Chloroflexota bacterium]
MNPDRSRGGMTVNALMQWGLFLSAAIPVVMIAFLGVFVSQRITISSNATTFVLVVVACAIVALIGVMTINYFVQREVKSRLLGLVDVCRDYAGGDRTVRASFNGDDEFAMLSMSLNTLLDSQGTSQSGATFSSNGNDAAALQSQIEKLLQEVSAVGDGDLCVQAEVTPDTLGVLADSFNYMIEELAKVVGRVQTTAVQVTNATRRIIDRSDELTQASETQVSQISHTTEAVEALAIFIQNVARNAQLSAEAAQEALRNANSGQRSVRQTIEGMVVIRENVQETSKKIKRLGERSNEIGEIVRIIEDIADQTNLLALNAAIQSAMAGEHGRGFAVVADEIRLLAERSTESTKRIDTLVKSIQGDTYEAVVAMEDSTQEVVKGSQLADEAGRSLNSIFTAVERQAQMIEGIARAANEQTTVSEAVAVSMGQISDITRQTNIGTQEAAASMSYLAELTEQLRVSVSTFRLPDRGDMMTSFPSMTSVTELQGGNGNQFFQPALAPASENDWAQDSSKFPPLAGIGNSASLVALSSRNGQFSYNNQPDFGQPAFNNQPDFSQPAFNNQPNFNGQPSFNSQPGFGQPSFAAQPDFGQQTYGNSQMFAGQSFDGQQSFGEPSFDNQYHQGFGTQPSFNNQQSFGGQQPFGNQYQQSFGGRQPFDNQPGFEQEQGFADQQQFGGMPGFSGQGQQSVLPPNQGANQQQSVFPPNQGGNQQPNSGSLRNQQPAQSQASYQRWQRGFQQHQSQSQFGQDQASSPNNGQFGQ